MNRNTMKHRHGLLFSLAAMLLVAPAVLEADRARAAAPEKPLRHSWRLVNGKSWQIVAESTEAPEDTDKAEGNRGTCTAGMVQIKGEMKTEPKKPPWLLGGSIEDSQKTTCTKWINRDFPERCAAFDREKWLKLSKDLPTVHMEFCIDRFEYPNRKRDYPVIAVAFSEAEELCKAANKRLCTETEWTFACEGEEAKPYPTGYVRAETGCVIDRPWTQWNAAALAPRNKPSAMAELDRLWKGEASGSRPTCKSDFGVYDLTGNVDEWTRSASKGGYKSIFKGGYWGPVRDRCRPTTRAHNEWHFFYQEGLRCCTELPKSG